MGKQLNLDTFNEILFQAFKDQSPRNKAELFVHEIQAAYGFKIELMEKVVEDLNNGRPYEEHLQQVNNVDSNIDSLSEQLDELVRKYPECRDLYKKEDDA